MDIQVNNIHTYTTNTRAIINHRGRDRRMRVTFKLYTHMQTHPNV